MSFFALALSLGLELVMSNYSLSVLYTNIIPTYFKSIVIIAQFIAFNNLVDLGPSLAYACQASALKPS